MNGSVQEKEEDQRQTHGNSSYCVNSFNVHNIITENSYNNIPVTRSSFFSLLLSPSYNLNYIVILSLETSMDYRLTVTLSFSTVAGLAFSCILAIYLCVNGKECISITSWFWRLTLFDKFSSHITIPLATYRWHQASSAHICLFGIWTLFLKISF